MDFEHTERIAERAARAAADAEPLLMPTIFDPPGSPAGTAGDDAAALRAEAIAALTPLERELAAAVPAGDPGLALLRSRLGGLHATRYLEERDPADREAAQPLLRTARASGTLDPAAEGPSRGHLIVALAPPGCLPDDATTPVEAMRVVLDLTRRFMDSPAGMLADMTELAALVQRSRPELPEQLPWYVESLTSLPGRMAKLLRGDLATAVDLVKGMGPVPEPFTGAARVIGGLINDFAAAHDAGRTTTEGPAAPNADPTGPEPAGAAPEQPAAATPEPGTAVPEPNTTAPAPGTAAPRPAGTVRPVGTDLPADAEDAWDDVDLGLLLELLVEVASPGSMSSADLEDLVERLGRGRDGRGGAAPSMAEALGRMSLALRTGDPQETVRAGELLDGAAAAGGPHAELFAWVAGRIAPAVLTAAGRAGGTLADRDEALRRLRAHSSDFAAGPHAAALILGAETLRISAQLERGPEEDGDGGGDLAAESAHHHGLLAELDALEAATDPRVQVYFMIFYLRAAIWLRLSAAGEGLPALRAAVGQMGTGLAQPYVPPFAERMVQGVWAAMLGALSEREPDPERVRAAVRQARATLESAPSVVDEHALTRYALALALGATGTTGGELPVRDEQIRELELARAAIGERTPPHTAHLILWELAVRLRDRGDAGRDDRAAALDASRESMALLADHVLLQRSADRRLEAARAGAARALPTALWAMADGRTGRAVEALESGRALVLGAAAASAGVPERLEALGEYGLAAEWRAAGPDLPAPAPAGPLPSPGGAGPVVVPGALRRRTLDALRRADGPVPAPADLPRLTAGVAAAGLDALVYLVPGQAGADGAALLVHPAGQPVVVPLPALAPEGRRPLEVYLDAAALQSVLRRTGAERERVDAALAAWERALDAVCDWAGPAVLAPVLDALPARDPGTGPVRLTLVPCGNLGALPWHAARLPAAPGEPDGYLCRRAVVSYAASGAEFLRSASRDRTPPGRAAVLVADPTMDLDHADQEVAALYETHYPQARRYGLGDDGDAPDGTPEQVLAHLPGAEGGEPASLLHLVVHGVAGPVPTESALGLAEDLTVARLLDAHPDERCEDGPLVVLSACETDLSTRDHDEALTLTTAFLARGAADVIGSRWVVKDAVSAVMMVVLHHYLNTGGLAPADALRAAQLWMLDPARLRVPGLDDDLMDAVERRLAGGPVALRFWAPFIHQGNPAPARPATTGEQHA